LGGEREGLEKKRTSKQVRNPKFAERSGLFIGVVKSREGSEQEEGRCEKVSLLMEITCPFGMVVKEKHLRERRVWESIYASRKD